MSYTIDVYNGNTKAEKHLGIFALFVSFWPQLVAGPIERSSNLLPQFKQVQLLKYEKIKEGLLLMLWGFFKKVVIADRLAVIVDRVYNNPDNAYGLTILIASYAFAFQIYCDFSGYSDIAIGASKVMGFDLSENFRRPYFSKSIAEFWKRWHISLSTWFRDYLYIPLGGNRVAKWRWQYNLFIVFLASGLWHGANWTYIVWGALHGFYMLFAIWTCKIQKTTNKLGSVINTLITFHLVVFAWMFFRANTISDAFRLISHLPGPTDLNFFGADAGSLLNYIIVCFALLVLFLKEVFDRDNQLIKKLRTFPLLVRWNIYILLLLMVLFLGFFRNPSAFIYFQF